MANHPSRNWRLRARLATDAYAALLLNGRSDDQVAIMMWAEVRSLVSDSFRAGFEAGRLDVLDSRRRRKDDVHPSR